MTLPNGAKLYEVSWMVTGPGEAVAIWHNELPDDYRPVTQLRIQDLGAHPDEPGYNWYLVQGYYVVDPGWKTRDGTYELEAFPE